MAKMLKHNINIHLVLERVLSSGSHASAEAFKSSMPAIAMVALIIPFITLRILNGLAINHRVAPTICIVLIKKRLLNMAKRIVLSISTITEKIKKSEMTNMTKPIRLTFLFIKSIRFF